MSREQSFEQVGASARLLRNSEKSDKEAASPPTPASIRLPKTIHEQSLRSKLGTFKDAPQDQSTDATPATLTPATTGSHARQSRHRRQLETRPEGRTTTTRPPKRQVVVSPARPSSIVELPAGNVFADGPREELILFEAPNFPTTKQQWPQNSRTHLTSLPKSAEQPGKSASKYGTPTVLASSPVAPRALPLPEVRGRPAMSAALIAGGRTNFVQFWTLSIVATGTLGLPLGMLILSYMATPQLNISSIPAVHTTLLTAASHSGRTKASPVPSSFSSASWPMTADPMTTDPWAGLPALCRHQPHFNDNTHRVTPQRPHALPPPTRRNLFCLFNATRFYRGGSLDFVPHNLPFTHCPNVVYWSFGITDGVPSSRTPAFEKQFGLNKLRHTANSSGAPYVKILLAVGGYREENPQLTLLDRDAGALSRFASGTIRLVTSNLLDGLAVHWREAEPGCQSGTTRDASALRAMFLAVRSVFQLNGFPGLLALILPTQVSSTDAIVDGVVDVVDYVFLEVRQVKPPPHRITYTFCGQLASTIVGLIEKSPRYVGNEAKFCPVLSVAPWLAEALPGYSGSTVPLLIRLSAASQSGSEPGVGSALNMRGPPEPCHIRSPAPNNDEACLAVTSAGNTNPLLVYMFHTNATLWKIFSQPGMPANSSVRCALLVDLDLDNYVKNGRVNFPVYWLIQYVYWALEHRGTDFVRMSMRNC
ncbi:hypothetical protein HPB49_021580 [Dermacentor silvarum]|uniref:Uncharacterized protein n=1 Tax=Dermacentor silvarum TaxID=543639 RepID=A0ACB8C5L1_DERSI|nr:hypothetical protein HPB49_021580 [Dermacentor silvarum]